MKNLYLFFFIALLASCTHQPEGPYFTDFPETQNLELKIHEVEVNILTPSKVFPFYDKLIVFDNVEEDLFKVFDATSLEYLYAWGKKGDAPMEFSFIDEHSIKVEGDRFEVLDRFALKTIEVKNDSFQVAHERKLSFSPTPINGLKKISDKIYFSLSELGGKSPHEFQMVDVQLDAVLKGFSEFPQAPENLDMQSRSVVFNKSTVSNLFQKKFASFYLFHNQFRIFNHSGELVKEVILKGDQPFDFTQELRMNKVTYAEPFATDNFLYVLSVNKSKKEIEENIDAFFPELHVFDWEGNMVKRYPLNQPITTFCVSPDDKMFYGVSFFKMNQLFSATLTHADALKEIELTEYSNANFSIKLLPGWTFSQSTPVQYKDTVILGNGFYGVMQYLSLPREKKMGNAGVVLVDIRKPIDENHSMSERDFLGRFLEHQKHTMQDVYEENRYAFGKEILYQTYYLFDTIPNGPILDARKHSYTWKEKETFVHVAIGYSEALGHAYKPYIAEMVESFQLKPNTIFTE
jgi:hypothetical protein